MRRLAVLTILAAACNAPEPQAQPKEQPKEANEEQVARDRKSMKGWELYCWRREKEWGFALLVGTNRLKSDDEIEKVRVDLDDLLAELSTLAEGQSVVLGHNANKSEVPPETIRRAIREHCRARGLDAPRW